MSAEDQPQRPSFPAGTRWNQRRPPEPPGCGWCATHGRTGWQRALLGSTAERVVRHAPCPVLTVPSGAGTKGVGQARPFKLQKLVVPVDFSQLAQAALPWATLLAGQFGAEFILLHVVEKFHIDYLLGRELTADTLARLRTQAAAELERRAASLGQTTGLKAFGPDADIGFARYYNSAKSSRAARIFPGPRRCARSLSRSRLAAGDDSDANGCRRAFGAAAAGPRRTQSRSLVAAPPLCVHRVAVVFFAAPTESFRLGRRAPVAAALNA